VHGNAVNHTACSCATLLSRIFVLEGIPVLSAFSQCNLYPVNTVDISLPFYLSVTKFKLL
jgi:hypothetical protein